MQLLSMKTCVIRMHEYEHTKSHGRAFNTYLLSGVPWFKTRLID
jgi:hypothetical protein